MDTKTTLLEVDNMTCPSCVAHIGRTLREIDGITAVDVRLREGTVAVRHDAETPLEIIVDALRDIGFPAAPKP